MWGEGGWWSVYPVCRMNEKGRTAFLRLIDREREKCTSSALSSSAFSFYSIQLVLVDGPHQG